jgi:hypothetical protein
MFAIKAALGFRAYSVAGGYLFIEYCGSKSRLNINGKTRKICFESVREQIAARLIVLT